MKFWRILVVDDSAFTRRIIRMMLAEHGYANVDEAANGAQALALMAQCTYALVISDWNMAPVSGIELLAQIRATPRWHDMPFIMATANSDKKFLPIARDNGVTFYILKPFSTTTLIERVTAALAPLKVA